MPERVLVIPDKFKGSLTSQAAAAAIIAGWKRARPADETSSAPMSDGGDGFGEVLSNSIGAEVRTILTMDAAHRACEAVWWYHPAKETAIIESARVVGLAMLPEGRFHPFDLDTLGLAAVFKAAQEAGARRCIVGIGGSATNDGGMGLARGMGWRFRRENGGEITRPAELDDLVAIEPPSRPAKFEELVVAVDVKNPLLGPNGCSRVFGPQKGLKPGDMPRAEAGLGRLAALAKQVVGRDFQNAMGAGAAGGLGFGLQAFLGATPREGFEIFSEAVNLPELLGRADLVITGEGRVDASSVMGKAAGSLAEMCRDRRIPCIALAGMVADREVVGGHFLQARGLVEIAPESEAKKEAARWLERLAEMAAREWRPDHRAKTCAKPPPG